MGPALALFWFTVRQTLLQRKIWPTLILLAAPAAISLLVRHFGKEPDPWERFHGPLQFALFGFGIPLVCMLFGAELIGSEVDSRTIIYLLTRRLRRATVFLVRFAAVVLVLSVLFILAGLATFGAALGGLDLSNLHRAHGGADAAWSALSDLTVYLSMIPIATVTFTSLFSMFGLAASRPLGLSIVYFIAIESVLSNIPAAVRQYSVMHFVRQTMFSRIPGLFSLFDMPRELRADLYPPGASGIPELIGIAVVGVILACLLVTVRELVPAKLVKE